MNRQLSREAMVMCLVIRHGNQTLLVRIRVFYHSILFAFFTYLTFSVAILQTPTIFLTGGT